ncbi:MAG: CPBP family intramembrane glutamic endopeptidase [Dehalococcoidia bacterium]
MAQALPHPVSSLLEDSRVERLTAASLVYRGLVRIPLDTLGGVVITFIGGLFFAWLRWRTGGAYGPILTHWLINSLAASAAFVAV